MRANQDRKQVNHMTDTEENKGYLGIIGAMQIEVEELIAHMTDCTEQTVSGITFTEASCAAGARWWRDAA